MEIIWLEEAKNDLINYRQKSLVLTEEKIENYIISLVDYVDILTDSPYLGKVFLIHKGIEVRQLLYNMHRIIYYIENNEIRIVAVIHTTRDIEKVLKYINKFVK